jgi:hypothetical protein
MNSDRSAFAGSIFGGLAAGLLPWQRVAMDQGVLGLQAGFYKMGIAEEIMQRSVRMRREIDEIAYQQMRGTLNRPNKNVWAYWQFKNGKIAALYGPSELPFDMDWYLAYDRSLGADVVYAAR